MNSLERVTAAVQFQEVDRVPVIPQVFGHTAVLSGVPLDRYVRDGTALAQCQLNALERYGHDAVFAFMDTSVEAEALGCELKYRPGRYPVVARHAPWAKDDLAFPDTDPKRAGRMPEVLKALGILRHRLEGNTLVVGSVLGPFTLTCQLLGLESALFLAVDNPDRLERMLDFATEVAIGYGKAQLEAGAHLPMVFDPAASSDVLSPSLFRKLEYPRLKRIFSAFSEAGALANWLHIAGATRSILPLYPEIGAHIGNVDYCVNLELADRLSSLCLDGNIRSLSFVESTPAEIELEAALVLKRLGQRRGFILSSGCEIPPESKPENIEALVSATRRFQTVND